MNSFIIETIIENDFNGVKLAYNMINRMNKNELVELNNDICHEENKMLKNRFLLQSFKRNEERNKALLTLKDLYYQYEYNGKYNNGQPDYLADQQLILDKIYDLYEQNKDLKSIYKKYRENIAKDNQLAEIIKSFGKIKSVIKNKVFDMEHPMFDK